MNSKRWGERLGVLLVARPNHASWRCRADTVQRAAGGDVKRLQIVAAECAVGYFIPRHGQEGQLLPFGAEHIDPRGSVLRGLEWQAWLIQARGDIEPALLILFQS